MTRYTITVSVEDTIVKTYSHSMEFCKQKNGKKNETSMDIKNKRVSGRRGNFYWNLKNIEKLVMPSNNLILCCPLLLLPSIFPSIRVFSYESALRSKWTKYWSFNFNISPSNEHPGLISFGMDWLDLLAVQGTLKSLLQHHSSKASIFLHSAFFIVQLSHPYMTTGKTIALTRRELLMDREAWHAAVHGSAKSWTWLSDWTELNWKILIYLLKK